MYVCMYLCRNCVRYFVLVTLTARDFVLDNVSPPGDRKSDVMAAESPFVTITLLVLDLLCLLACIQDQLVSQISNFLLPFLVLSPLSFPLLLFTVAAGTYNSDETIEVFPSGIKDLAGISSEMLSVNVVHKALTL